MRKKIFFGLLLACLLSTFLLFASQRIYAARNSDDTCSSTGVPNDTDYFPFRFFCGSDNNGYKLDVPFRGITSNGDVGGGYASISPNQTLEFQAKFISHGMAKSDANSNTPRNVIMWVTIDINDSLFNSWVNKSGGDTNHACPGSTLPTGNSEYIVYNYQTESGYIDSHDQSPAAYTGSLGSTGPSAGSQGYESCGSQGRLIYWQYPSVGANQTRSENFSFKIDAVEGSQFCLRQNVSVVYPGDHIFPTTSLANRDTHAALSRVAKQSERHCFEVRNKTPTGNFNIKTCGTYSVNGEDPDHPGQSVDFHVIHASGAGYATDFSGTTTPGESTSNPARTYNFAKGRTYIYKIRDKDNGNWYTINSDSINNSCSPTTTTGSCSSFTQGTPAQWTSPGGNVYETRLNWVAQDGDPPHHQLKDSGGDLAGGTSYNAPTHHPGDTSSTDDFIATPNVTIVRNLQYYSTTSSAWVDVPGWNASHPDTTWNCYRATCSLDIVGQGPHGEIVRGPAGSGYDGSYTVNGTIYNVANPAFPDKIDIPLSISDVIGGVTQTYTLSITSGGTAHNADSGVSLGDSVGVESWTGVAAAGVNSVSVSGYADMYGKMSIDSDIGCNGNTPVTKAVYDYATFSGGATATLMPNDEDPTSINYSTYFQNNSSYTVPAATVSCLYKDPNSCAGTVINGPINGTTFAPGTVYTQGASGAPANAPITLPVQAGDKYCAYISVPYNTALVTNYGGTVQVIPLDSGQPYSACPEVTDKPFFKAYDSGLSAGGNFSSTSSGSCSGGGTLGGWFNNMTPGYGFGTSTELSALALLKTTGVASAKTSAARNETDLAFANQSADKTQNDYSPSLGGNYGSGVARCLTDTNPKTGSTALTTSTDIYGHQSIDLSTLGSGSYTYNGPATTLTIYGGTNYANGKNIAIFTNADVYINTDISYSGAGSWASKADVPSFVINSSKNIYIDSSVTKLDGQYIAEPVAAGTYGTIYTCGDYSSGVLKPVDRAALWSCNNQLLVHGNFIADHVNLMRTYGSMRDEKPVGATSLSGVIWNCGGSTCNTYPNPDANPALRCAKIDQSANDPHTWQDNFVCVPKTSGIYLGWTNSAANATTAASQAKTNSGSPVNLPNCTRWNVAGEIAVWNTSWLCTSSNVNFTFVSDGNKPAGQACTQVYEPSELHVTNWLEAQQKTFLCEPVASPGSLPSPLVCSHAGTTVYGGSCAAEVFDFSPEMYLPKSAVEPPNRGAPIWQGITSLPPVL